MEQQKAIGTINYPFEVGPIPEGQKAVLSVRNLAISFRTDEGLVRAVRGVSFDLYKGETLCIVGESGSGKSVTSKTIMGILPATAHIDSGSITYEGEDLTKIAEDDFHRIRGTKIGMIFQDPLSSLNPIMKIGKQITEVMIINGNHLKHKYDDAISNELVAYKNDCRLLQIAKSEAQFTKKQKKATPEEKKKAYSSYLLEKKRLSPIIAKDKKALKKAKGDAKVEVRKMKNEILARHQKYQGSIIRHLFSLRSYSNDGEVAIDKAFSTLLEARFVWKNEQICHRYILNSPKSTSEEKEAANRHFSEAKVKDIAAIAAAKKAYRETLVKERSASAALRKSLKGKKKAEMASCFHHKNFSAEYADFISERRRYVSEIRVTHKEAKMRALRVMKEVGISEPERRFNQYPFEFSGGMRQRIVIAIALTADPDVLICDEPTTALDVTIQAQILELINKLKVSRHMSIIFITHDLGVVANMADRVAVMYAGKIVEFGTSKDIFYSPAHPYTWALLSSIPDVDSKERLEAIPGTPPNMLFPPKGDAFALRSKYALGIDFKEQPKMYKLSETHYAATWLLDSRAPLATMPKIVSTRIDNSLRKAGLKK